MRLINVKTYELHDFITDHQPPYAILSHTWGAEEITFPEMQTLTPETLVKDGFRKIDYTCQEARRAGLAWAWVDTCCIDKSSSAELSEAINSMFQWYQQSAVCYVYLVDLDDSKGLSGLADCRWFTRGFCLQELLAPNTLVFFSTGWVKLQESKKLTSTLSLITGIEEGYLRHERDLSEASVAKRMSWAANRQCTRAEDVAYCLLGIFDINMPLLYGEGKKAFLRLQEEIWKEVEDHSLLAWSVAEDDPRAWALTGVFAESPSDFRLSGLVEHRRYPRNVGRVPSNMTQRGMSIDIAMFKLAFPFSVPPTHSTDDAIVSDMELNCYDWRTSRAVSMLAVGVPAERKFTRIATVGNMDQGKFGTCRVGHTALNPVGKFTDDTSDINNVISNGSMVFLQRNVSGRYQYCDWNQLAFGDNLILVRLSGLNFGTQVADFTTVNSPKTQPLAVDAVKGGWPATTHCVYDPKYAKPFAWISRARVERLVGTYNLGAPRRTNHRSERTVAFELLLEGNPISPNEPRLQSISLRCGIFYPDVKQSSSTGEKSWLPWVCLALAPWTQRKAEEADDDLTALDRRKRQVYDWAEDALQPVKAKDGIMATASTSLGARDMMRVTMEMEDTSNTGSHPEIRAPRIIFRFSHTIKKPAWMEKAKDSGIRVVESVISAGVNDDSDGADSVAGQAGSET